MRSAKGQRPKRVSHSNLFGGNMKKNGVNREERWKSLSKTDHVRSFCSTSTWSRNRIRTVHTYLASTIWSASLLPPAGYRGGPLPCPLSSSSRLPARVALAHDTYEFLSLHKMTFHRSSLLTEITITMISFNTSFWLNIQIFLEILPTCTLHSSTFNTNLPISGQNSE